MPEPTVRPEFEHDAASRGGNVIVARLRADAALAAYFATGGGIEPIESDLFAIDNGAAIDAPFLGVALGPLAEIRTGNANYTELAVAYDLWYVTQPVLTRGNEDWLRARVINAIKAALAAGSGLLEDDDGRFTEALVSFDRLDFRGRLKGNGLILTLLRVVYRADIDQLTREYQA